MNAYRITFSDGSELIQLARSYPEALHFSQRFQMVVVRLLLIKGTETEVDIRDLMAGS